MPDNQRRLIGPLQVIGHQHRRSRRRQLVRQRRQYLDASHRRVAVPEHPQPPAAQQITRTRPPRIRRTRPHPQHHPQRQLLGQPAGHTPPDIPPRVAPCDQRLSHQRRLADAGLALDPDDPSLTTTKRLDTSTQNRELLFAAHPLRRPA